MLKMRMACFEPSAQPATKSPGGAPGLFLVRGIVDQAAAGLNSFDALALIGSAVSEATRCDNSASSLVWAVNASNCFLACEVHSSIASEGDFTATSAWAKSRFAAVEVFIISITLAEYSLAPLLALVNTASMVPLWVSATSLNLA